MKRKEIQQNILNVLHETSGSSDRVEVVGNIGISYNKQLDYLGIVVADSVEYMEKINSFSYTEYFFQGEQLKEIFGDILENSERIRWNKIRKYVKGMY